MEVKRLVRAFARRVGHHIVAVFKETTSGAENDRVERKKAMALAQAREIDPILVAEMSRWGRSTQDLVVSTTSVSSTSASEISWWRRATLRPHSNTIALRTTHHAPGEG